MKKKKRTKAKIIKSNLEFGAEDKKKWTSKDSAGFIGFLLFVGFFIAMTLESRRSVSVYEKGKPAYGIISSFSYGGNGILFSDIQYEVNGISFHTSISHENKHMIGDTIMVIYDSTNAKKSGIPVDESGHVFTRWDASFDNYLRELKDEQKENREIRLR
ncbi:MAG: hypothetical protein IJ578_00175 [Bacteroidales bacterium]|nr:hypothetical protein [Bacteroidales bacterium]